MIIMALSYAQKSNDNTQLEKYVRQFFHGCRSTGIDASSPTERPIGTMERLSHC